LLDGRLEVLIRRFVANVRDELLKTTLKAVLILVSISNI
jgi:hypothetical protein